MPLHSKDDIRHEEFDDIYATTDLAAPLPKYKFPQHERAATHAYAVVHDELMLDGNSRLNLATFCQTWTEPEVRQLLDECLDKNMIDKDEYPQAAEIEKRCVHMLADLWNSPHSAGTIGCSTAGSSEAAMLGGLALKWKWRERRQKEGKPTDRPNMICGPVQVCWHKFARYFDVELREIPMEEGRFLMTPEEVIARCDENTIGVVPTLGVTFNLQYEPVEAVANSLDEFEKKTGLNIPIHVDGASGAFLAPFLQPEVIWDFRLPRVKSVNASGHKFGLTPLGCGWVIWREKADLPDDLIFDVNYLGGNMPTFALNFSRPGGQVICQYYNFIRLGKDGYQKIQQSCAATGQFIAEQIGKMGIFEIVYDGKGGIPGACWVMKKEADPGFTLFDLADRLRVRGWQLPAYSLPAHCEHIAIQRCLVRHGVSRDIAKLLVADIKAAVKHLQTHKTSQPLTEKEAGGHHH